jgi:hypothetical protein
MHTTLADIQQLAQEETPTHKQMQELYFVFFNGINLYDVASPEVQAIVPGIVNCMGPTNPFNTAMLEAASLKLMSPMARACIFEKCLENIFKQTLQTSPLSWESILPSMNISSTDHLYHEFTVACQTHRSYLTLYADTLRRLPECRSFQDELKICVDIQSLLGIANIKLAQGTEKLALFIPLLISLQVRNLNAANIPEHHFSSTVGVISDLASKLMLDREKSGLLGFVGLGDKSVHPARLRLLMRIIHTSCVANTMETGFNRQIHVRTKLTPAAGTYIFV